MTIIIISILSGLALLFSMCTVGFSILAYTRVLAMEKSTHQIQYMPVEQYSSFQESIEKNEDTYYGIDGKEITDPIEKEKMRQKELLNGFEQAYTQE